MLTRIGNTLRRGLILSGLAITVAGCGTGDRPSASGSAEPGASEAAGGGASAPNTPDAIYYNGRVLTVDAEFSTVEAIAISGERILAVGTDTEILALAGPGTRRTDLEDRTVVPGLIDNHMHFVRATRDWYRHVRWDAVDSRATALGMLAERSAGLPPGEWVVVIGGWTFDQFLDDASLFTVEELDAALGDRPVYIQEGYRRGFANSAALAAAGIDAASVDFGGRGAMGRIESAIPAVSPATWDASLARTLHDLHGMGLTAVYDVGGNGVEPEYYDALGRAAETGALSMRVFYSLHQGHGIGGSAAEIVAALETHTPDLEGLALAQFGWGESTYAPMRATPWQLSEQDRALYESIARTAAERGWQLHEHSMRDEKIAAMLDVFEAVDAQIPIADARWTIAHTNRISRESVDRANALGVVFAVHSSNRLARPEGAAGAPPIAMIHESGGIWGLGSDATTVASPNPFHNIGWAVTGRAPGGGINLTQTVSREAALAAHTRANAYLLFREGHLGSLEPGKLADFVVLDRDYMSIPAEEIEDLRSIMTVVGGEVVYTAD